MRTHKEIAQAILDKMRNGKEPTKLEKLAELAGTLLADQFVEDMRKRNVPTVVFRSAIAQLYFAGLEFDREHDGDNLGEVANTLVI